MPFFNMQTAEQIENYCAQQGLDDLKRLKTRMFNFFKDMTQKSTYSKHQITAIDKAIEDHLNKIAQNKLEIASANARNSEILGSLPGNGAERYLALQALHYPTNIQSEHEEDLKKLNQSKEVHKTRIAAINLELNACLPELQIVDKYIDAKTPVVQVQNMMMA